MNENQAISVDDAVAALFVADSWSLAELIARLAPRAGVAVFEHPYMAPLIDVLRAVRPELPIVYSAHNVETDLKRELWRDRALGSILSDFVKELESELVRLADLVVACTELTRSGSARSIRKSSSAPNGCRPPAELSTNRAHAASALRVGFLGSAHTPNAEAARYILDTLAPECPEFVFEFVGGICSALEQPLPENAVCMDGFRRREKSEILAAWDVGLNPIMSGGGSSLKLPDYRRTRCRR